MLFDSLDHPTKFYLSQLVKLALLDVDGILNIIKLYMNDSFTFNVLKQKLMLLYPMNKNINRSSSIRLIQIVDIF